MKEDKNLQFSSLSASIEFINLVFRHALTDVRGGERLELLEFKKRIIEDITAVERILYIQMSYNSPLAKDISMHLMRAGGKRFRPFLTLLISYLQDASLCAKNSANSTANKPACSTSKDPATKVQIPSQGDRDGRYQVAAALELVHLASLYHDDIMDSSPERRGVPAAHIRWGISEAILAGDLLLARASAMFSQQGIDYISFQAHVFERLVLGQVHELEGLETCANIDEQKAKYIQILKDKTGSLIGAGCVYGLGFSPLCLHEEYRSLKAQVQRFGECLGVAFQLIDDVLDYNVKAPKLGKILGADILSGVQTMPVLLLKEDALSGCAKSKELCARIDSVRSSMAQKGRQTGKEDTGKNNSDKKAQSQLQQICADLAKHSASTQTLQMAKKFMYEATSALEVFDDCVAKRVLLSLANCVMNRRF